VTVGFGDAGAGRRCGVGEQHGGKSIVSWMVSGGAVNSGWCNGGGTACSSVGGCCG
jgi:hypothetical protein